MIENNPAGGKPQHTYLYGFKGTISYTAAAGVIPMGVAGIPFTGIPPDVPPMYAYNIGWAGSVIGVAVYAVSAPAGSFMRFRTYLNGLLLTPFLQLPIGANTVSINYVPGTYTFVADDYLSGILRANAGYTPNSCADATLVVYLERD